MKNKTIILIVLCLLIVGIAKAELKEITTVLSMTSNNNTVTVSAEGNEYAFSCGQSLGSRTLTFTRDIDCGSTNDLRTIASTLSSNLNESHRYYEKYIECYGQNLLCQQKIGTNTTTNWEAKYSETLQEYQRCTNDKSSLVTARQAAETQLSTCQSDLKRAESDKTFWGIGGIILGIAAYYFLFDKSRKKPAMSVAEQQLPRSR